jgi:hypothetical protein
VRDVRETIRRLKERDLVEKDEGYVTSIKLGQFDKDFTNTLAYLLDKPCHAPDRSKFQAVA